MTSERAREVAENQYRARLHAQLGALKKEYERLTTPPYAIQWLKRLKLAKKIERIERELDQRMLLPPMLRP